MSLMYQYTSHFDLKNQHRQPFLPTVHSTEVILGTLHTLTQGKSILHSQIYASTSTSFSSNKNHNIYIYIYVIPSTDVIKPKYSVLPYIWLQFQKKTSVLALYFRKMCNLVTKITSVSHYCHYRNSQSLLHVYFKKQLCIATSHVIQQTCISDYISHRIRLIFIQSADQPD
jgi:hypothetical protein